jgi:hypothetical protein
MDSVQAANLAIGRLMPRDVPKRPWKWPLTNSPPLSEVANFHENENRIRADFRCLEASLTEQAGSVGRDDPYTEEVFQHGGFGRRLNRIRARYVDLARRCWKICSSDTFDASRVDRLCRQARHIQQLERELVVDSMCTDLGVAG